MRRDLFAATQRAQRIEKAMKTKEVEEYAGRIRAAAYVLVAVGRVYIWPVGDLDRHLKLAIEKLEAISGLDDHAGDDRQHRCRDRGVAVAAPSPPDDEAGAA